MYVVFMVQDVETTCMSKFTTKIYKTMFTDNLEIIDGGGLRSLVKFNPDVFTSR